MTAAFPSDSCGAHARNLLNASASGRPISVQWRFARLWLNWYNQPKPFTSFAQPDLKCLKSYVSRSTDGGKTWKANLVYHAPLFTALNNVFPALAVDPTNGKLYASWSDAHTVFFSTSSDQGSHWPPAVAVNITPARTAL